MVFPEGVCEHQYVIVPCVKTGMPKLAKKGRDVVLPVGRCIAPSLGHPCESENSPWRVEREKVPAVGVQGDGGIGVNNVNFREEPGRGRGLEDGKHPWRSESDRFALLVERYVVDDNSERAIILRYHHWETESH